MNGFDVLGTLANLIEVVSFIVVVILFLQARRQFQRYLKTRATAVSEQPWAIAVGIGGDIQGQVKRFLDKTGFSQMPLENYVHQGYVPPGDFYKVLRDMLRIKNKLAQGGATEVHLFYRGPVTLAMGIGSIFDNWVPVKIYEYDEGSYRLDFVLEKGTVLGLLDTDPDNTVERLLGR